MSLTPVLFLLFISASSQSTSIYRLSNALIPLSYDLTLHPSFEDNRIYDFKGYEYIEINITADYIPINDNPFEIRIHQGLQLETTNISLSILNITYSSTNTIINNQTEITNILFIITNNQLLSLLTDSSIIGTLYIQFVAMYRSPTDRGVFISSYTYNDTKIQNIATQFEPVFARTCFPCFDEPAMKAKFKFTFIAPINATVLYNTPINSTIYDDNNEYECYYEYHTGLNDTKCKIVTFEISPLMPTYLNTFIIGDYQSIQGINPYLSIPHNLYYPWNKPLTDAQWSYNASLFTVHYFGTQQLFDYSYTKMLPKLDDIAITDRTNAMEHWGLVTYDTSRLMTNPLTSDLLQKIRCSLVIGHELGMYRMLFVNVASVFSRRLSQLQ